MLGRADLIEAAIKLWGPPTSKTEREWRFGTYGSKSLNLIDNVWRDHEADTGGGILDLCRLAKLDLTGRLGNGHDTDASPWITYDYVDEKNALLFQVVRKPDHSFRQRRPNGNGDWIWNVKDTRRVLYRLPQVLASTGPVFVCEGEKDADNLAALGVVTTSNPMGANKWRPEYSDSLKGRSVIIVPDHDEPGREHAAKVSAMLTGIASSVRTLWLPGLSGRDDDKDVSDWILKHDGTRDVLFDLVANLKEDAAAELPSAVAFDDFWYYSREGKYIFGKDGSLWPAKSVDLRLPWIGGIKPSTMIARNHAVEQMTWSPGEPTLVKHKLVDKGGWLESPNATVFNHYRPPKAHLGNADNAKPWIEHVRKIYPDEAEHIIQWLAYRSQKPQIKIKHALVLSGEQGIGKDSLLAPALHAVGFWNVETVSPQQILGRFTSHLKSVILIVSEARDLGDVNRPQFYEHLKTVIVSPPDVLKVDEKNTHEYYIPNLTGVVITTNHKAGGIFLAPDDRRHFVAWSKLSYAELGKSYFDTLWNFYDDGGLEDVATYLRTCDISRFDPHAPPPKTDAFWEIVGVSEQPEVGELADALEHIGNPAVLVLDDLISVSSGTDPEFAIHLRDRKNRRMIAGWMEKNGYRLVRNPDSKQGLWPIRGKRQNVYGKSSMSIKDLYHEIRVKWG
jgi:hypothetical protein